MPAYITSPQPVQLVAVYPGNALAVVNNASVDAGITTTQQFAVGATPGNNSGTLVITNSTNQEATGQYASHDVAANYEPLSGCIIGAGASLPYNLAGGWMRFTFVSAPTSGSLIVSR